MGAEIEPRGDLDTKLERLRALSNEAESGDKGARAELRQAIAGSSPEVIAEASSVARQTEWMLVKTISAGDTLMQEALVARTEHMRAEIAGENPTPSSGSWSSAWWPGGCSWRSSRPSSRGNTGLAGKRPA